MQACTLCGSEESILLFEIDRFRLPFPIHRCRNCGLIFMKPFFSDQAIADFYNEEYFTGQGGEGAYVYTDERRDRRRFAAVYNARIRRVLRALHTKTGTGMQFLDVGCAFGGLLEAAARQGFSATGMDIAPCALQEVAQRGRQTIAGSPESVALPADRFHAVTMIEVIEHLKAPRHALENILNSLRPGGLLVVQTANMDGMQARRAGAAYHYFLPGHLHYFSRRTLGRLLEEVGFRRLRFFHPCEFGLYPKLVKSRADFKRARDYLRWLRIAWYHSTSKIHWGQFALTSGMVVYARKPV